LNIQLKCSFFIFLPYIVNGMLFLFKRELAHKKLLFFKIFLAKMLLMIRICMENYQKNRKN